MTTQQPDSYPPEGEYHYYHTEDSKPVLCEVRSVWVYRLGYDGGQHIKKFTGKFVPLIEQREQATGRE